MTTKVIAIGDKQVAFHFVMQDDNLKVKEGISGNSPSF